MNGNWTVWTYNELDAEFGYDPGAMKVMTADKATAKAVARALNKRTPHFVSYYAEQDRKGE